MSDDATANSSLLRGPRLDEPNSNQEQQYSTFSKPPSHLPEHDVKGSQSDECTEQLRETFASAMLRPIRQMMSSTPPNRRNDQSRPEILHLPTGQDMATTSSSAPNRANVSITNLEPREKQKPGALPRPVGGNAKLGTFTGVFVPTSLNVLSILMFLRFGFILGQAGVLGMMGKPPTPRFYYQSTYISSDAHRLLSHQFGNYIVHLCDSDEWHRSWWWRVLLDLSITGSGIRWFHRDRLLSRLRIQYWIECGRSNRLLRTKFRIRDRQLVELVIRRLLVAVSLVVVRITTLHGHLSRRKWYLREMQQWPPDFASRCDS